VPFVRGLPEGAGLAELRGAYSSLFDKLRPYGQALMRGPSPFTPAERELIAAYVSGMNACRYCFGVHSRVAGAFGVDAAVFDALMRDVDAAPVDARLKPVLRYARKLTEAPSRVTRADADAVYAAGWDDTALVHAVAVCAYFNMMNRLLDGSGIVAGPDSWALAAKRLADSGYEPPRPG
jgi:uncharacterized peroxidase-related enzyme